MLINFSTQIAKTFVKMINGYKSETKTLPKSEMELFPQVVTDFRGELRILPNI